MAKPHARKSAKKKAKAKPASNARGARKPAQSTKAHAPVTIETRPQVAPMGNDARRLAVTQAMEIVRTQGGPGSTSTAWKIDDYTLWEMCCLRICDMRDAESIIRDYRDEISAADVRPDAVRKFIARVRGEVSRIQHEAWKRLSSATKLQGVAGDPLAATQMLMDRLLVDLLTSVDAGTLTSGSVGDKHAVLRGIEIMRDTVEILAKAKLASTKNEELERKLDLIRNALNKTPGKNGEKPRTHAEIVKAVKEAAMGIPPTPRKGDA